MVKWGVEFSGKISLIREAQRTKAAEIIDAANSSPQDNIFLYKRRGNLVI